MTFSKCMKMSIEKIDASAEPRHNHDSTIVGKTVFQDMRCKAPNEAPKRQINGQSFERYNPGSQCATTTSLTFGVRGKASALWMPIFTMSFWCSKSCLVGSLAFLRFCAALSTPLDRASCRALSSAYFSNTRGVRYQMFHNKTCSNPSSSNLLLTDMDSKVCISSGSIGGRSTMDSVWISLGFVH